MTSRASVKSPETSEREEAFRAQQERKIYQHGRHAVIEDGIAQLSHTNGLGLKYWKILHISLKNANTTLIAPVATTLITAGTTHTTSILAATTTTLITAIATHITWILANTTLITAIATHTTCGLAATETNTATSTMLVAAIDAPTAGTLKIVPFRDDSARTAHELGVDSSKLQSRPIFVCNAKPARSVNWRIRRNGGVRPAKF
ncbi:hypothetical protein PWT90_02187 [Aphanocladium album]|nr:hypothetical protein PWT90_02187 [Aphanocladium album]